jgi:hypothetical protein
VISVQLPERSAPAAAYATTAGPVADRTETLRTINGRWHLAAASGALGPLSYVLELSALTAGAPLSLVAPAREMSMMVGGLIRMWLLGEAVSRRRLVIRGLPRVTGIARCRRDEELTGATSLSQSCAARIHLV